MNASGLATAMLRWIRRVLVLTETAEAWETFRATLAIQGVETELSPSDPPFDCIIVESDVFLAGRWHVHLPALSGDGAVYIVCPPPGLPISDVAGRLSSADLRLAMAWTRKEGGRLAGIAQDSDEPACILMAVRETYAPLDHAKRLFLAGKADWSLELLHNIPPESLDTPESTGRAALLRLFCFLAWDTVSGSEGRLNRFCRAQREFYHAVNCLPHEPEAYFAHARFWKVLGRPHVGARLLRSFAHVTGNVDAAHEADSLDNGNCGQCEPDAGDTTIEVARRPLRIAMICHEHSDYGLDTLYYGLTRVLGSGCVVEFPWKPTLHGKNPEAAHGYPCTFDLPGKPRDAEWFRTRLSNSAFDLVVYADTLRQLDRDMVRSLMAAATNVPLVIMDTWDEAGDYLADTLAHMGRTSARACFKREMLAGVAYPPNTYPLPFSYPDDRVSGDIGDERDIPLFWAGKRQDGIRRLLLGHIENVLGLSLDVRYSPDQYARVLDHARVGLCMFGLGFDTVRYWELPAHGCLLLAERPPIRIPHNFADGISAVFFDDAAELDEKLRHYLAHPEESAEIACAGHEHLKRYHTSTARARQFLAQIETLLNGLTFSKCR